MQAVNTTPLPNLVSYTLLNDLYTLRSRLRDLVDCASVSDGEPNSVLAADARLDFVLGNVSADIPQDVHRRFLDAIT